MPPAKSPRSSKKLIPFSSTRLVASTRASRLAFRKKIGITTRARSKGEAKSNRLLIAKAKRNVIPHRTPQAIRERAADKKSRKMENKMGW